METVHSQDIKDAANLMADDLVVVYVFESNHRKTTGVDVAFFP
jgi:hypothetical protein